MDECNWVPQLKTMKMKVWSNIINFVLISIFQAVTEDGCCSPRGGLNLNLDLNFRVVGRYPNIRCGNVELAHTLCYF